MTRHDLRQIGAPAGPRIGLHECVTLCGGAALGYVATRCDRDRKIETLEYVEGARVLLLEAGADVTRHLGFARHAVMARLSELLEGADRHVWMASEAEGRQLSGPAPAIDRTAVDG